MIKRIRSAYARYPDLTAIMAILAAFFLVFAIDMLIVNPGGVWGSDVDWSDQHFSIPEYLRTRYFETGDWSPDFAMQLGAGQNIYNLAYYGIANPLYLPAYFMPWITMADYIQILSIIEVLVSAVLSYYFFKRHFSGAMPLVLALMFILSGPLIFHSHRHVMFINYYPFLMGLLLVVKGRDSFLNLLLITVLTYCTLCASYFYSVGVFTAVGIYIVFNCFESDQQAGLKKVWSALWRKALFAFLGGICAARFWMPALAAIISGRASTSVEISLVELLVPTLNLSVLLYTSYSAGLTVLAPIAIISLIKRGTRSERFLAGIMAACVLFPVIVYLFNGTMYVDGKAFIPFMPLILILCGRFMKKFIDKTADVRFTLILFAVISVMSLKQGDYNTLQMIVVMIDTAVMLAVMFFSNRKDCRWVITAVTLAVSLTVCIALNCSDKFVKRSDVDELYCEDVESLVDNTLDADKGVYRFAENSSSELMVNRVFRTDYLTTNIYSSLSNPDYRNFRFFSSGSEVGSRNNAIHRQPLNVVFDALMGCRYRLVKDDPILFGEKLVDSAGGYSVYKNDFALPLGFASSDIMSADNYRRLQYELQQEAILSNIIVPKEYNEPGRPAVHTKSFDIDFSGLDDYAGIEYNNRTYSIVSDKIIKAKLPLDKPVEDGVLIITAFADNRIGRISAQKDVILRINGMSNKLTDPKWRYNNGNYVFSYVISSDKPITELDMEFSAGTYNISGLEAFVMEGSVLRNAMENKDPFIIDTEAPLGDELSGSIDVRKDGWFNITLPYDKHFDITLDGEKVDYYRTDLAFIGFPIEAGKHYIEISYHAPLKREGQYVTAFGGAAALLLLIAFGAADIRARKREKAK